MLRLICGGILALCSAYIGLGVKKYYSARENIFEQWQSFIEMMSEEVSYLKSPLSEIIENFKEGKRGEFIKIMNLYQIMLFSGERGQEDIKTKIKCRYLTKIETELLHNMLLQLGKLDSVTQLHNLSNIKARVTDKHMDCKKKSSTIGSLAFKLGVLMGVLIMIILA